MAVAVRGWHPETASDIPMVSRKEQYRMTNTTKSSNEPGASLAPPTLAALLAALDSHTGLSETRRRDCWPPAQLVDQI
jgi:hypothetical protein